MSGRVGFVGLGVMGAAMAANLLKAGFAMSVSNRSRARAEALLAGGARWFDTPAAVAREADVILLSLPDTTDVESVLFGDNGVAEGARPGAAVIDTSSISAAATIAFAARLKQSGVDMIDSPVSGGPQGAVAGTLTCMVGGDAGVVERVRPVLSAIGKTITHLGPSGAGQLTKACNQLVIAATLAGVSEAIALCQKAGVDPARMREALLAGSARSFVLENHARRLLEGQLAPGFRATLMQKDIRLAAQAMRDFSVFAPATALAEQLFAALVNIGHGGSDSAALGLLTQKLSEKASQSLP
jgi:2-hydroxy-3-oxopropionate reductase